jgi:hypothetical protein
MPIFGRRQPDEEPSGPPPEIADRIRRRWHLLNDLRPLGAPDQLYIPYGTDEHLKQAQGQIDARLNGMDEVRESVEMFAISLLKGAQRGLFTPADLISVMGADQRHLSHTALIASDAQRVSQLAGAASEFLHDFQEGPMWDFFQQRDDVACEILTWIMIAVHRLGSAGLCPVFPVQPPL